MFTSAAQVTMGWMKPGRHRRRRAATAAIEYFGFASVQQIFAVVRKNWWCNKKLIVFCIQFTRALS
jgi:hypothetical protein